MIPLPHLSLIVLLLAIASWSMELQAGVITGLRPQKRLVFVKLSGSESQTLKRGDKVKIESIHDFSRGIVRGVRGRMARIKVVKIGVLSKNTKVKVVKKNKGRTATQVAESKARMRAHRMTNNKGVFPRRKRQVGFSRLFHFFLYNIFHNLWKSQLCSMEKVVPRRFLTRIIDV